MNVPRLHRLEELLCRFEDNCSPDAEEVEAIATIRTGIFHRLIAAKQAGKVQS